MPGIGSKSPAWPLDRHLKIPDYPEAVPLHLVAGDLPDELADEIRQSGSVAVDTETSGLDWRRDALELCQLFTPLTGPILIRRTNTHPRNLVELLESSHLTKVFHHAPFDLRFLESTWGARTSAVLCTKTGSKLIDPQLPSSDHSLAALLARHFGMRLDKGTARVSDWSAPELSPGQIEYAAADVTTLLRLAEAQAQQLRSRGLQAEFAAVCAYLPIDAHLEVAGFPNPLVY